jgi:hypothetical protein
MLNCCQPFTVQKMEISNYGSEPTWVMTGPLNDKVKYCPFCGRQLINVTRDQATLEDDNTISAGLDLIFKQEI